MQSSLRITAIDQVSLADIQIQLSDSPISLTLKMTDCSTQGRGEKWPGKGPEISIHRTWGRSRRKCEVRRQAQTQDDTVGTVLRGVGAMGSRHRGPEFNGRQKAAA